MALNDLVIFLSVLTIVVSYFQWATAYQKVLVDLFDRRMAVYENVERAVGHAVRHGSADAETVNRMTTALVGARFLFDEPLEKYVDAIRNDILTLHIYHDDLLDRMQDPERARRIKDKYDALRRISDFTKEGAEKFAPYMRMRQKLRWRWLPG
jgi:hypothetical protein